MSKSSTPRENSSWPETQRRPQEDPVRGRGGRGLYGDAILPCQMRKDEIRFFVSSFAVGGPA